jgi:hypothetical protein
LDNLEDVKEIKKKSGLDEKNIDKIIYDNEALNKFINFD